MITVHRQGLHEHRLQENFKRRLSMRRSINDGTMVLVSKGVLDAITSAIGDPRMMSEAATPTSRH